jgi:hypothetical protein
MEKDLICRDSLEEVDPSGLLLQIKSLTNAVEC